MNLMDILKDLTEFNNGSISVIDMSISLLIAFVVSIYIIFIYRKTYSGVIYSRAFSLCIILLAMVTSLVIRTINANLALSLGMIGALSIVRFRTAVKEPVDTGFMFWAIAVGIMSGAGLYLVTIVSSLALGLLYAIGYIMGFKVKSQYLLVLRYEDYAEAKVVQEIMKISKSKLKSKSVAKGITEATYEIEIKRNQDVLQAFGNYQGVLSASIISYQNDFGN